MPRPQFSIRTLLWLTLAALAAYTFGPSILADYAPKWGKPTERLTSKDVVEKRWSTGRVEHRELHRMCSGIPREPFGLQP
ncbi:MAG TPA: hypothetical protein VMV10_17735 [Pirellulales bacterium]|nr:hypothetical protein [Pirellulales bacterium]